MRLSGPKLGKAADHMLERKLNSPFLSRCAHLCMSPYCLSAIPQISAKYLNAYKVSEIVRRESVQPFVAQLAKVSFGKTEVQLF